VEEWSAGDFRNNLSNDRRAEDVPDYLTSSKVDILSFASNLGFRFQTSGHSAIEHRQDQTSVNKASLVSISTGSRARQLITR
jgi:hypothetical protein